MHNEIQMLIEQLEQPQHNIISASEIEVLATKLLFNAQKVSDTYGATVAYYFLALSYYQKGNTAQCLSNASMCNELSTCNHFTDYYISSCNLIGIVYVAMSEQFLALDYYLKGYYAAKKSNNYDFVSRILNNIGDMFFNLGVYEEALLYFKKSKTSKQQCELVNDDVYAIVCMNIIECELILGKDEDAIEALRNVSDWISEEDSEILNGILLSNEIVLYGKKRNYEKAKELIITLLDNVLSHYEYSHTFNCLLRIRTVIYQLRDHEIGERYISVLKTITDRMNDVNFHLRYQEAVIEYYSIMEDREQWLNAIAEYYYINERSNQIRKENYYNSLVAKVQLEEILQEQAEIIRQNKELETLSEIDELTQIYNRRAVEKHIISMFAASNTTSTCALIIMDLDHFKEINDTYGHLVGDIVLANIGTLLRQNFRENDIVGRLGGDEFIIFMYNIHKDNSAAKQIVSSRFESLLQQIRDMQIENHSCRISASVGITLFQDYSSSFTNLYHSSDTALYEAKKEGRDRFIIYNDMKKPVSE